MTSTIRRATAAASLVLALGGLQAVTAQPASAVPCGTQCAAVHYDVIDVTTYTDDILYQLGWVAECSNPGGTCSITKGISKTTDVQTAFSATKAWVGAQVGVSVGFSSSTSVSCNSPKLKAGQIFRAYPRGVTKMYRIKQTVGANVDYSGYLFARQPYATAIHCQVDAS